MSPQQRNISIIRNCEDHFCDWLKNQLGNNGILTDDQVGLTEILSNHENELDSVRQHLKPIKRWNKVKDECFGLSSRLNGNGESNDKLSVLVEKTAFEGQILWLTIQDS